MSKAWLSLVPEVPTVSAMSLRSFRSVRRRLLFLATLLLLVASLLPAGTATPFAPPRALANTPDPTSVTIAGSLQSELGCPGDWDPACAVTHLTYDAADDVWQGSFDGSRRQLRVQGRAERRLGRELRREHGRQQHPAHSRGRDDGQVLLLHNTHWVTDNVNSTIAVVPGSFQSELGCPGDWDPSCLRSWLQDPDGDGIYTFETTALPVGSYEAKVAINEGWTENYGQGAHPAARTSPSASRTTPEGELPL